MAKRLKEGPAILARGLSQGTLTVAKEIGHISHEIGHGLEKGFAGVTGAAGAASGRKRTSTCRRRNSEANIFGCEDLVSEEYTLQSIHQTMGNKTVTKLELEDIISRHDERDEEVFDAIKKMLVEDDDRSWKHIKFIDSLRISELGGDVSQLQHYSAKQQALWNHIKEFSEDKPVFFQVKLEILEDTGAATIIKVLQEIQKLNLINIDFGGGLFGYKAREIDNALFQLCKPEEEGKTIAEKGALHEMIMLELHFNLDAEVETMTWKQVIRRCLNRMRGLPANGVGRRMPRSVSTYPPASRQGRMKLATSADLKAGADPGTKTNAAPAANTNARSFRRRQAVNMIQSAPTHTLSEPLSGCLADISPAISGNKSTPGLKLCPPCRQIDDMDNNKNCRTAMSA